MTEPLWTGDDLARLPGASLRGGDAGEATQGPARRPLGCFATLAMTAPTGFGPIGGVSIDTRTLAPGDLFFAIRGVASDGHDHVRPAFARGAAAAVVAEARAAAFADAGPLVVVPDVLAAMGALGRAARARTAARIVGVTGSVGKTGTKEALRLVLSRVGRTHAADASYNNHWGVPLTLARMPAAADFGVFEIGMNHPGEIVPLAAMVRPHVAIVTSVEPVHIGHFRSILGIADAKGEIFSGLEPGGVAVVPRDNPYVDRLLAHVHASRAGRAIGFGESPASDVRALRIAAGPDASIVEADILGRRVAYRIGMPGRHVALNSLAVLAAIAALGLDVEAAAAAYAGLEPQAGRGERVVLRMPGGEAVLVDESFNANPASMRAALATLGLMELPAGGRRIAILADMGELGASGPEAHRGLAGPVEASGADLVFAAGPLMAELWEALPNGLKAGYADHASKLEPRILDVVRPGDVVMVKGSKSTLVSKVAASLKARFGTSAACGRA